MWPTTYLDTHVLYLVSHIEVLVAKLSHYKGSHAHGEVKADLFIFLNLVLLPLVSITFAMS
jgi:nitrate reductase NapE component